MTTTIQKLQRQLENHHKRLANALIEIQAKRLDGTVKPINEKYIEYCEQEIKALELKLEEISGK